MAYPSKLIHSLPSNALRSLRNLASASFMRARAASKWIAHRHPTLLAGSRCARTLLSGTIRGPQKLLPGFEPLCVHEHKLKEIERISPALRDDIITELASLSSALDGNGADLSQHRWWLEHPLDSLMAAAAGELNIVYSLPKVGGSTLGATLAQHSLVYGSHFLGAKGLAFMERSSRQYATNSEVFSGWRSARLQAAWLRMLLAANRALRQAPGEIGGRVRKPFVVAGVREPAGLHLSLIFHCWQLYVEAPERLSVDRIHRALASDPWGLIADDWFSCELREMFGLDVYAQPFPTERGWEIYENADARVLVIRQENLSALSNALCELFAWHPKSIKIVNANIAAEKSYAPFYTAVKGSLHLSRHESDLLYSLPYVRHFYTLEEIEGFKKRWQEPGLVEPFSVPDRPAA